MMLEDEHSVDGQGKTLGLLIICACLGLSAWHTQESSGKREGTSVKELPLSD